MSKIKKIPLLSDNASVNIALDTIQLEKQALVFVNTKRSAEKIAEDCSKAIKTKDKALVKLSEDILKALSRPTKQCERLSKIIKKGVAFHHAGLCLPYETEIVLSNGQTKKIGQVFKEFKNGKSFQVMSLDPISLKIGKEKISDVFTMEINEKVIKIKTRLGKELILTQNHPLLTIGKKGDLKWEESRNLNKGDFIATARELIIEGNVPDFVDLLDNENTYVYHSKKILMKDINTLKKSKLTPKKEYKNFQSNRNLKLKNIIYLNDKLNKKYKLKNIVKEVHRRGSRSRIKVPDKISKEFLRFVGFIAADGTIYESGSIRLELSDKSIVNETKRTIQNNFGINNTIKIINKGEGYKQAYKIDINLKIISDVLTKHLGLYYGKKSDRVFISPLIKKLPKSHLSSYLSGLFDCDGGICISKEKLHFEYNTASKKLAEDIQYMLLRLGIYSYASKKNVKGRITKIRGRLVRTNSNLHRIFVYGVSNLKKMLELNLIRLKRKKETLETALKKRNKKEQVDIIPNLGNMLKEDRKKLNLSIHKLGKTFPLTTIWRLEKNKNPIRRDFLQRIARFFNDNRMNNLAFSDILWDRIEKIEYVRKIKTLYDIEVSSTQNFIVKNGIICHNTSKQRELIEDNFRNGVIKVICATTSLAMGLDLPAYRAIIRDLRRYSNRGMVNIPVLEYLQMAGRAGRPKYDKVGEAIAIAGSEPEREKITEKYVYGEPEDIYSKLAVEPVLRTYLLSLIATNFTRTKDELLKFFKKTFWAHQFKDMHELEHKIMKMLNLLEEWEFIRKDDDDFRQADSLDDFNIKATLIGKRVAELYIDPLTAHDFILCLTRASSMRLNTFSFLQMICNTLEIRPLLRVKVKEYEKVEEKLCDEVDYLLKREPSMYEPEYEVFLNSVKTAMMLHDWVDEKDEEYLMEEYGIRPGELNAKRDIADWLLFSSEELVKLLNFKPLLKELSKLRLRLKYGVKEELLPLLRLKQIGRVRARKLFRNKIKTVEDVKKAKIDILVEILGKATALSIKKQVGEEIKVVPERKRKGQISLNDY